MDFVGGIVRVRTRGTGPLCYRRLHKREKRNGLDCEQKEVVVGKA